jgi:hypothetical protein
MRKASNLALLLSFVCAPTFAATAEVTDVPKPQSTSFPAASTNRAPTSEPETKLNGEVSTSSAKQSPSQSSPESQPAAQAGSAPATSAANSAQTHAAGAESSPVSTASAPSSSIPSEALPGPYETDRKNVRKWLLAAKERGVGLGAYIPVWDDMENAVKSGAPDAEVKTKLDGILRSIRNQVNDSSKMQAYRPKKPKPTSDEDVEIIRVKWVGKEKGSDSLFREKANKWFANAVDMLPREQRQDATLRRKLYEQRDVIYKEMKGRWEAGEKNWGPKYYTNHNQDMGQSRDRNYSNPANNP